jgi:hypothetical protein
MATRRTREEIEALLSRYQARGSTTRQAFCMSEGIPPATLGYYLRRRPASLRPTLAQVHIKDTRYRDGRFVLVLENGRRIECGRADLGDLISAAERV